MEIIKLNLIPSGVNPTCHCSQYDNGRVIRIELFDGLTPYTLQSGDTVTLNVRKPDNTIVTTSLTATQGNKYVDLVTTEQICACVGYNLCDLTITNGSVVIGTLNFVMAVERDVLADGIPSQSVIEDLDELVQEAVGNNYYTKTETDDLLDAKADKSTTYTKTEVDSALALKANSADVYTKTESDAALALKANSADVYTKAQIDAALVLKADKSEVYNTYPTDTESGSIASFTDGADNIPVKSLIAQIVAQQAGSGDPSTSNVRAISGFSACNIVKNGANQWDEKWELGLYNSSDGTPFASNSYIRSKSSNYINVIPNTNYYICSPKTIRIFEYDSNYQYIKYTDILNNDLTLSDNCRYIRFCVYDSSYGTTYNHDISINYPSTDTQYHAYNGETKQISFGSAGTVYGGNLNVTTGLLTITHAYNDLGTLTWLQDSAYGSYFYTTGFSNKKSGLTNMICNKYANATGYGNLQPDLTIRGAESGNVHRLFIRDNSCADITAFNTAIQGAMLCYEIETPQTVQLTPTEVKTLLGTNNIFADTGDVAVNYRADIGLYIDKKISQIPAPL